MRTVRIDFTSENLLPDGDIIGRMGEHNATDLIITPPAEMTQCEEIVNYVAAFVTEGKIIRSDFYPKAEQITIPLCSQLTQDHSLGLQLEGYDGTGGLVVKSAIVSELKLLPSAGGDETDFDGESGGIVSQINLNTLARHEHSNKDVLDKFGEEGGILTFDGAPAMAKKTKTLEFDVGTGEVMLEPDNTTLFIYICDYVFETPPLADGTELVSIELNTGIEGVDEWVDLRDMIRYDLYTPYILHVFRAFRNEDVSGTYLAIVNFYSGLTNIFFDGAIDGRILRLRVTFVDESAE